MKNPIVIFVLLPFFFMIGCTNVPINKEAVDQIDKVTINPNVTYAEKAFNNSPGRVLGLSAGAV